MHVQKHVLQITAAFSSRLFQDLRGEAHVWIVRQVQDNEIRGHGLGSRHWDPGISQAIYPLVNIQKNHWKWSFIVDFPIKNGDFL